MTPLASGLDGLQSSERDGARDTIFVSIASYRDPQLRPTIEDCLAKARRPERLRFGISWDHGPEEVPLECFADPAFRVLDVDYRQSRGVCWARAEIMKLWDGESWFLQLDSHHRFAQDWDARLLNQMAMTGRAKPILTTYGGRFDVLHPELRSPEPTRMQFECFTDDGMVLFRSGPIPDWQSSIRPRRSRFLSAGLLFAPGQFVAEVPYDPRLYFLGEEISLAVRAFTYGYDLFQPGEIIVWHEYTRSYRRKHWDDHTADNGYKQTRADLLDARSREIVRRLLIEPHTGPYGCGTQRTVADYEAYAGISFVHRRVQDYTRRHLEPPNPPLDGDWAARIRDHSVRISIATVKMARPNDGNEFSWYVGVHDSDRREIYRADADSEEIDRLLAGNPPFVTITRELESESDPAHWTVWPYTLSGGWGTRIDGVLSRTRDGHWAGVTGAQISTQQGFTASPAGETYLVTDCYPLVRPQLSLTPTQNGFLVAAGESAETMAVNGTGALVLELADGQHSLAEIACLVRDAFALSEAPLMEVVSFIEIAARQGLVSASWSQGNAAQ